MSSRFLFVLTVLALIAWPVSYFRPVAPCVANFSVGISYGMAVIAIASEPIARSDGGVWRLASGSRFGASAEVRWRPSTFESSLSIGSTAPKTVRFVFIPLWWFVLLGVGLFLVIRRIQSARRPANGCTACGYNLTGNLSGVCPECGEPIK